MYIAYQNLENRDTEMMWGRLKCKVNDLEKGIKWDVN